MRNLAIIPARGNSKRIPRKNLKSFLGKPIIIYSIEVALNCGLFDEVMVSTDDDEIADIAVRNRASVPFMRSEKNSDDFAGTIDVIEEVIHCYSERNIHFENFCCIYPTAPLVTMSRLNEAFSLLKKQGFDSVFPVLPFSYPPLRGLTIDHGKVKMVWPEYLNSRSQDLGMMYHDSGQFYMATTEAILKEKTLWTKNTGAIILSELEAQDIDNEIDWKMAEMKYSLINMTKS